nr:MAG TPA: Protein of unknown function (DUF4264) [Crassvirales sp.]
MNNYYIDKEEYNKLHNFIKVREYQMFPNLYKILNIINKELK